MVKIDGSLGFSIVLLSSASHYRKQQNCCIRYIDIGGRVKSKG